MERDGEGYLCITCATRDVGRVIRPPLLPIPVDAPFDRVGVNVVQFPKSKRGNKYAVVFIDYLTKRVEVFPTADQSALTIAHLLVQEIVSRHGVNSYRIVERPFCQSYLMRSTCLWVFTRYRRRRTIRALTALWNAFTVP